MEFIVVTHHTDIHSCSNGLKDMEILSLPEPLMIYTGCKDKQQFAKGIVHIAFAYDHTDQLAEQNYCSVNGSFLFRHPDTFRTAIMSMCSEKILLQTGDIYCINKIHNVAWQHDDEICLFLGVLQAKVRLRIVKWLEVSRNDCKYYAFPCAHLTLNDSKKNQLKFLKCEFGINVVYKENEGSLTHRSHLLPTTLICTDEIIHGGLYSIIYMKPRPTYVLTSSAHKEVFGVDAIIEGQHHEFEDWISQYHTVHELERIKRCILPRMHELETGHYFSSIIEFSTPNGLVLFDVCIRSTGRSCLIVTFAEHQPV